MSKEYARLSIEEVMGIASNHMEEDAVHAQVVLDFAADIEKEVASRCRAQGGNTSDSITQAAANKVAEEGELPEPPKPQHMRSLGYDGSQMREYARAAIAADRASRQVANKAEVEPIAHLKFWASQSWSGSGNHDVEHGEGLEVCQPGEIGDDGKPAFPVFAPPPANTGASTVPTGESADYLRGRADGVDQGKARIEIHNEAMENNKHYRERIFNEILKFDEKEGLERRFMRAPASTVLTDDRIMRISEETALNYFTDEGSPDNATIIDFAREIEREVAAQAGQVAPADDDLLDVTRTLCSIAARRAELSGEQRKHYPHADEEGSPLLTAARAACLARGYTEDGLAIPGVNYPITPGVRALLADQAVPIYSAPVAGQVAVPDPTLMGELRRWAGDDPGYAACLIRMAVAEIERIAAPSPAKESK